MREVSYAEAIKRKYLEQIALAVSADSAGRVDVITLGWAMPTSGAPPMWAISVGHTRHSHKLIGEGGEFVLAFPSTQLAEACRLCGTKSGRDINKVAVAKLCTEAAKLVRPPLLAGCLVNFECRVRGKLVTGDHTVFAGEVVAAHVDDEAGARIYNFSGEFREAAPRG